MAALSAAAAAAGDAGAREWAPGAWSTTFFRPQKVQVRAVGLVNEGAAYFATRTGVSALHDGMLTPIIDVRELEGASVAAFHLCHHRNSIFYEVFSPEGGFLSIYEYSLAVKQRVLVREFQDGGAPAVALACVDQMLLRASPDRLLAIGLQGRWEQVLQKFEVWPEGSDSLTSIAVGFAADVVERAQIYAVASHNRSLLRLSITGSSGAMQMSSEVVLPGGQGADGPAGAATALEPLLCAWARGGVLLADGCALRQVDVQGGRVRTLVGVPDRCAAAQPSGGGGGGEPEERLEPAAWASLLSRPLALAGPSEATAGGVPALLLTSAEVVQVDIRPSACAGVAAGACEEAHGCGWAAGPGATGACLDCGGLERWAAAVRPGPLEACSLQDAPRANTSYALGGCGCAAPSTSVPPRPSDDEEGETAGQVFLVLLLVLAGIVVVVCLYRSFRRNAIMRDLYHEDTAEFHVFTDDECVG